MIQLPKFDTFNKDEVVSFPEVSAPGVVTVSEIKQTYTELGVTRLVDGDGGTVIQPNQWNLGVQESNVDGTIVSRAYAELIFDEDAFDFRFEPNPTDVQFGGLATWRVIHRFTEKKYESNYTPELQNFKIWQLFDNRWQQEIIYDHVEIGSLQWDRPEIEVNVNSTTTGGGNTGQPSVTAYTCSTTPAATSPPEETGDSTVFSRGSAETLECYREASLPIPFSVVFDVGEALGGFIETDGTISDIILLNPTVTIVNDEKVFSPPVEVSPGVFSPPGISLTNANGSESNPIKFATRYIQVLFNNPTTTKPTYVRLRRYGQERFRFSIPFEIDLDPEILNHPSNATFEERLKPPTRPDFPDNFWNDGGNTTLGSYASRIGSGGSVSV